MSPDRPKVILKHGCQVQRSSAFRPCAQAVTEQRLDFSSGDDELLQWMGFRKRSAAFKDFLQTRQHHWILMMGHKMGLRFGRFPINFLGCTGVDQPKGIEVVKEGIRKLKFNQQLKKAEGTKPPKVELTISVDGVAVQEPKTKQILHQYPLHRISYCADDKAERRFFAFIAKNSEEEGHTCFVFVSDKLAEEITLTIGQAFDLAYRRYVEGQGVSPGTALKTDFSKKFESLENENATLRSRLKDLAVLVDPSKLSEYLKQKGISDVSALGSAPASEGTNGVSEGTNGSFEETNNKMESSRDSKGGATTEDLLLELGGAEENGQIRWEGLEGFDPAPTPSPPPPSMPSVPIISPPPPVPARQTIPKVTSLPAHLFEEGSDKSPLSNGFDPFNHHHPANNSSPFAPLSPPLSAGFQPPVPSNPFGGNGGGQDPFGMGSFSNNGGGNKTNGFSSSNGLPTPTSLPPPLPVRTQAPKPDFSLASLDPLLN
ncbi:unnamed protein product [Cyprideis torosa]|uniref:Uncharacterized protein n=1 Tax=Cyprideis torosa TaxID=163714 RepID=A0A7R8WM93_9CRUS|nr:unnamed protein product [Cyprideis torosa]CAG0899059.1 unnamed protein product [Cyprideis torosa]